MPYPRGESGTDETAGGREAPAGARVPRQADRDRGEASRPTLRISLLGPMTARIGGAEVDLGAPQQQAILAVLLLQNGSYVSVRQLIDAVWGNSVTATAEKTVRTYVYRLREAFGRRGEEWRSVITSVGGGYTTALPAGAIDVDGFVDAAGAARQARRAGEHAAVVEHLRRGLSLWRGNGALSGIPGEFAERMRTHLQELRLSSLEMHLSAQLSLGMVDSVVAEVSALIAEYPLDERFRALFMIALYQNNRRAEALLTYHEARELLQKKLGVDTGEELRKAYTQILQDDICAAFPQYCL